jgi:1-phosphofructokinase
VTFIVCPNLAVDRVVRLPKLAVGTTMRGDCLIQQAGGKGSNVARALAQLGGRSVLGGFAAGHTGRLIADLAAGEGLDLKAIPVAGESRISTVVLEANGRRTDFFERGSGVTRRDERALLELVATQPAGDGEWAVVDGLAPVGVAPDFYARLVAALQATGYRVLLDAEGEQLRYALAAQPELVKINLREAQTATPIGDVRSAAGIAAASEACRRLVADGAGAAIVTLGGDGSVAFFGGTTSLRLSEATAAAHSADLSADSPATASAFESGAASGATYAGPSGAAPGAAHAGSSDAAAANWSGARGLWRVLSPTVQVANSVGSGDCFAAAFVLACERGEAAEAALRAAAGTAAANAASELTAHFDRDLAVRLTAAARVEPFA